MTTDNKIDWMTAKGWLKDEERKLLFGLASRMEHETEKDFMYPSGQCRLQVLNIGVEFGASVACLRAGAPDSAIYAADIDWSKSLVNNLITVGYKDSHELVKNWDQPLDLIFVDGDHGKRGVLLDAGFADWLTVGGYILFHDCWDWTDTTIVHQLCPGVNEAVSEWFAHPDIQEEFEELPSVETTRVFKRVKEHGKTSARDITRSGGPDTELQPGGNYSTRTFDCWART